MKRRISIQPYIFCDFEKESIIQGFMLMGPRDQDTIPHWQAHWPFSSPEDVLVSVSIKNRDFWAGPTPEVLFSPTSRQIRQIWLRIRIEYSAHAQKIESDQRSRSLSSRLFLLAGYEKEAPAKEKPDTRVFIAVFHFLIA